MQPLQRPPAAEVKTDLVIDIPSLEQPRSIDRHEDLVREKLALGVLPELIVVLGMVMAFYFGSKR